MRKERPEGMRMMRAGAAHTSAGCTQHEGAFDPAVGDVVNRRGLLNNLSHCLQGEVHENDVHDGMAACQCGSDAKPCLCAFRDGRVTHPCFAKFFPQAAALLEVAASRPNALPYIEDVWVASHLFTHTFHTSLGVGDDTLGFAGSFDRGRNC